MRLRHVLLAFVVSTSASVALAQTQPAGDRCRAVPSPIPSGITDRPLEGYGDEGDYFFTHSSVHLQGRLATEKWAGGLLYEPIGTPRLEAFRSAVVVNNPDPALSLGVDIEYYDELGVLIATSSVTIPGGGTHSEQASPLGTMTSPGAAVGRGTARIASTNGNPFVGAVVLYTDTFDGFTDPETEKAAFGATSMQQLQTVQPDVTELWWGPIPVTNTSAVDALNGMMPFFSVVNPSASANNVSISYVSEAGNNLTQTLSIPPFGSLLDTTLLDLLAAGYPLGDDNYRVRVQSLNGQPLIGDGVLTDFFSDRSPINLNYGDNFRMASMMMAGRPAARLVNPEFVYQPVTTNGPIVSTVMGLLNAATVDVGPVIVRYRDRDGIAVGIDTINSLPPDGMVRIGPGFPDSPNYPASALFAGSVEINACTSGIVGWSLRAVFADGIRDRAEKMWGEALHGANGDEPGPGFTVQINGESWKRKLLPLVRVDFDGGWHPGYQSTLNDRAANIGDYWFRYYRFGGIDVTDPSSQPFAGLRLGATSFTHQDSPINFQVGILGFTTLSGAFDHEVGQVKGVSVIGDPIEQWSELGF